MSAASAANPDGPGRTPTDQEKLEGLPRELARWQAAQQQLVSGRTAPALAGYRELVKNFPGVAQLWFELGIAAAGELEFTLANQAFRRASELAPDDVSLLVLIGQQYHRLRQMGRARACFERAVTVSPDSVHARMSLAAWYERERRLDDAWQCVEACLVEHPQDTQAKYFRAFLLHRKGLNSEAETALRDLIVAGSLDPNVKYSSRQLLGVVLDELGQYPEALRWIIESKAILRQLTNVAALEKDYDRADHRRRQLLASLTTAEIQRWRLEGPAAASTSRLVFLGGHPRSGTTLLEQVLGAHPEILAFDEADAFVSEVWNPLAPMQAAKGLTLEALSQLPATRRAEIRRRYLKSLLREIEGEPGNRVLLDKNPSSTTALHLWLRLFPDSKVIIALRDPRDVVISCFFQNLMVTTTNVNFLSLERAVRHYSDLMDVWLRMRELSGFDWIETRYEDVVSNLENEGRRVTEFTGLNWHDGQAKFHETARRKILFAPTYEGVTKPVHSRAVGRWEHYAEALAPIQPKLAPYCRAFGYSG